MRYEDNDPIDPRDREQYLRRREQHGFDRNREENFHDFSSRWGHPETPFEPRPRDWHPRDERRFRDRTEQFRDDWRPFERQIDRQEQHYPNNRPEDINERYEPRWRQRDMYFDRDNQHANDRWQRQSFSPPPHFRHRNRRQGPPPEDFRPDRDR